VIGARRGDLIWKLLEGSPREWIAFVFAFLGAVGVIWFIVTVASRQRDDEDPAATDHQMLTRIEDLRQQGDLSYEEYRSIKGQLIQRLETREGQQETDT